MYIVAIAWLYVALMMAITEATVFAGITTFLLYGLLPCGLVMYLLGAPARGRAIKAREKLAFEQERAAQHTLDKSSASEPDQ